MNACWCSASAIRKRTRSSRALQRVSRAERCEGPRLVYPRHPLRHTRGWKIQTFLIQWICRPYWTLAKITHRRRLHYRCIGAKSPWVPERRFGTLARRQEGEIGRATSELQSPYDLVCRLLLE